MIRTLPYPRPEGRSGRATNRLGLTVYGCDQFESDLFAELSPRFGIAVTTTDEPVSETTASLRRNRCISVGHKSPLGERELRALNEAGVKYVCTRSIGLDHIDLDAAAKFGIVIENAIYAPDGVADFTLMLILMSLRNAKTVLDSAARDDFRLKMPGKNLRDLTVGVVGVGNIGKAVIERLQGFGCSVLAYNDGRNAVAAAKFVPLPELLRASDVVTLHVPLNTDTHHLIGPEEIEMMRQGAFLINTGRGALVDTAALIPALEEGTLGGAALDVLEGEEGHFYFDRSDSPIENDFLLRLQSLPNAIVTPHSAYYTERALADTVERTLIKCAHFERNRPPCRD